MTDYFKVASDLSRGAAVDVMLKRPVVWKPEDVETWYLAHVEAQRALASGRTAAGIETALTIRRAWENAHLVKNGLSCCPYCGSEDTHDSGTLEWHFHRDLETDEFPGVLEQCLDHNTTCQQDGVVKNFLRNTPYYPSRQMLCDACTREWIDVFTLAHIIEIE